LLQNGRILAPLDFLAALAFAVPPTVAAPCKDSSSSEAPSPAANAFAVHMGQPGTPTGGPTEVMPLSGASGTSSKPSGSALSDGTARARQIEPLAPDLGGPGRRPTRALEAGTGQIPTIAEAMTGVSPIILPGDGEATIVPEVPGAPDRVEAEVSDRPDDGQAEISVAAMQAEPERPILMPASEPLLPPSDRPAAEPETDPAKTPELQAGPASTGSAVALAPASMPGTGLTIVRQARPEGPESGLARTATAGAGAPVLPAAADPTEPSGATGRADEQPAASDPIDRAVEPRHMLAPRDGADSADQARRPEKPAAQDTPFGSQARATEPSLRQPSSDPQPARLAQISGQHGNAVAFPQPVAGVSGEIAQLTVRALDGAPSAAPEAHPATRQIALQITKALDQDRTEIRIRLDPPELGEVDIQLEFRDLRLSAAVSAERSDTLELLQRDSRSLARALREAGLELADADLSFAYNERNERPDAGPYAQRAVHLPHPLPAAPPLRDLSPTLARPDGFVSLSDGRMDLRV
jgi:flagellar hook-length control protein FliK